MDDFKDDEDFDLPAEPENGLIFDHPLLAALPIFDRITVTAHYASLVKSAVLNSQLIAMLRIINLISATVHTSTMFNDEQKQALIGLAMHIQSHMGRMVAEAEAEHET